MTDCDKNNPTGLLKAAQLTSQMLRMRDAMRSLWGASYVEKIAPWQLAVRKVADGKHLDPLQAAIALAKADESGHAVLPVMAAYVEMVEPTVAPGPISHTRCIGCCCTDDGAFINEVTGLPRTWIRIDRDARVGVCSQCASMTAGWDQAVRCREGSTHA